MNRNTEVNGINQCLKSHLNQSTSKQTQELCSYPSTHSVSPLPASPCRAQAQLCLLLPNSQPPQPKKPAAAPGPTRLLPCQGTRKAQKWECEPVSSHSIPPSWIYCLDGGQAPSRPKIPNTLIFLLLTPVPSLARTDGHRDHPSTHWPSPDVLHP